MPSERKEAYFLKNEDVNLPEQKKLVKFAQSQEEFMENECTPVIVPREQSLNSINFETCSFMAQRLVPGNQDYKVWYIHGDVVSSNRDMIETLREKTRGGSPLLKLADKYVSVSQKLKDILKKTTEKIKTATTLTSIVKNAQYGVSTLFTFASFPIIGSFFNSVFSGSSKISRYYPDAIIGTVPMYSVQRIERGLSDRILKYRAIGDVFLAHQKGSTDTLRVDGTLYGDTRLLELVALITLQAYSETELKDIAGNLNFGGTVGEFGAMGQVTGQYESHFTVPIITQSEILLDMYLQTIEWHHTIDEGGYDIIKYHLLFRKHIEPKNYFFDEENKRAYIDINAGKLSTSAERRRKEAMIDTIYKIIKIFGPYGKAVIFGGEEEVRNIIGNNSYAVSFRSLENSLIRGFNNFGAIA